MSLPPRTPAALLEHAHAVRPRSRRSSRDQRLSRAVVETLETRRLLAQSIWAYPGADG